MLKYIVVILSITSYVLTRSSNVQTRTWDEAVALATTFAKQMTLEEKCNMTAGVPGVCVGTVTPVPRLNFNGLCFKDSPSGVGNHVPFSTAFVAGIQIAATWDRDLFYQRAAALAQEFRAKGANFALGPMMNIDRNALGGRNWEGFGADPYLSGQNAFAYVQGVQDQGVVATAKHYICNEQETNRFYSETEGGYTASKGYSANLDDKTIHEIYLWPFADSVLAGAGSIMCSYNQVNGTQACENDRTLNGLLKGELGFRGNVMSDWGATKSGIPSVLAGLDIDMPGDKYMGFSLVEAVKNGSVSESRIDDMIVRILAPYYLLGQDQGYPTVNLSYDGMRDHYVTNRDLGIAGIILLKNVNNTLPLNAETQKYYSVYGSAASQQKSDVDLRNYPEIDGALYQGGGSGFVRPTYFIDPLSSLMKKARDDHLQIQYVIDQNDYTAINRSLQDNSFTKNGPCIVFISAWSKEGADRANLSAYNDGEKLIKTVLDYCPSTIVVVNSVAQLNLEAWIDHPHVAAVIWSGLPGTEYGPAFVDVLFGNYNPGGKLVFTIAKNDSDYGTNITTTYNSNYTEGVFLDYRHFDKYNIKPRFSFGFGLSYTTFTFSSLFISKANEESSSKLYRKPRLTSYMNSKLLSFYEPVYTITFTVRNTGSVDGSEVAQLYLTFPEEAAEPPKILRGFERVYLEAGQSQTITLALTQRDISYWNVVNQKWIVAKGKYTVSISTSANNADIKLQQSFEI